jgi:periplasmic divalent cation tolerance protein
MSDFIQVATTCGTRDVALAIARRLVEDRLAACVQVSGPFTSVYRWRGAVESAEEWLCTVKTRGDLFSRVEAAIRELHTYEVPEILATPLTAGSGDYLTWLNESLEG